MASAVSGIVGTIKSGAFSVAERLTPILTVSRFKETGVLTPEEFVIAGDHMAHHCPTWQWVVGDPSKSKSYLPKDKQFLVTKNVPCYRRCRQMEYDPDQEKVLEVEEEEGDEGWVDTHHFAASDVALSDKVSEMKLEASGGSGDKPDSDDEDDDGPAMDMEDMDNMISQGLLPDDDPNVAAAPAAETKSDGNNIVETRTYDLNITYDKLYQVPRMWLSGYDEKRKPLSVDQMYEDFSEDHARKTITMETHPHLPGPPMASIHPCRHAEVMKRLIEQLAENGKDLEVFHYLLIFMKFVQAVIPTIEYDYTRNVDLT